MYSIADTKAEAEAGKGIYKYRGQNKYNYMGVDFEEGTTEELKEYVGGSTDDYLYSYAKINGKKYYLDPKADKSKTGTITKDGETFDAGTGIFYIDSNGTRNYSQVKHMMNLIQQQKRLNS